MAHVLILFIVISVGAIRVVTSGTHVPLESMELPGVEPGGRWHPQNCSARHRVAVIVPFRDREAHLKLWLRHMHPFLQKQLISYRVFLIEQVNMVY